MRFTVMGKEIITNAIQVCLELNSNNLQRETSGLIEAMKSFKLSESTIVAMSQTDHFTKDGMMDKFFPFHEIFPNRPYILIW